MGYRLRLARDMKRLPVLLLVLAALLAVALGTVASPGADPARRPAAAAGVDISVTSVARSPSTATYNTGATFNILVALANVGTAQGDQNFVTVTLDLGARNLSYNSVTSAPGSLFTCSVAGGTLLCRNSAGPFPSPGAETLTISVTAGAVGGPFPALTALASDPQDTNAANNFSTDAGGGFSITGPTSSATATRTSTPTGTPTTTVTPTTTLTPLPSFTLPPTVAPTLTPTFIPPPATRTPLPRPANAGQAVPIPPSGVQVVVNIDNANVRLSPAIGADLVGTVPAGTRFDNVEARSGDGEWLRVNLLGQQGWIGIPVISVLAGDIGALPIADPRTIPFGGFENPRAGLTSASSALTVRLANSGMRIRGGPSIAYPVLANAPRYTIMPVLGRTADSGWFQVNFEGTLGWIRTNDTLEFSSMDVFTAPPVDGIVADGLPFSDNIFDSYTDTLRLLLARLDIATGALNDIRALWTNVALGQPGQCGTYPPQPSDYNIPNALLAAYSRELGTISEDFNRVMAYIRDGIRLLIEACSAGQPSTAAASVALEALNNADAIVPDLRARIVALLPPDRPVGANECLFSFGGRSQILPRLINLTAVVTLLDSNERVLGFCFDGTAGQSFRLEALRVRGNIAPRLSVSSFRDPTTFIASGELPQDTQYTALSGIIIPETGQYLVIVSDISNPSDGLEGDLALMLTDLTAGGVSGQGIGLDANGNVVINPVGTPNAAVTQFPPGFGGGQTGAVCPSLAFTCAQLLSCAEAQACLAAGNRSLDPNGNGLPCEENLCRPGQGGQPTALPTAEFSN